MKITKDIPDDILFQKNHLFFSHPNFSFKFYQSCNSQKEVLEFSFSFKGGEFLLIFPSESLQ